MRNTVLFLPHQDFEVVLEKVNSKESKDFVVIESRYSQGPLFKLVQIPLDGIPAFRCVNHTTQFGAICKLAEGARY